MDLLTDSIVTIISKSTQDALLAKEVGPDARDTATKLYEKILHYLRNKPESKVIADGFEKNPDGYKVPLQDQVDSAIRADEIFKQELTQLFVQFETQKRAFSANIQINVDDGGAVAVGDSSTALGQGSVIVDGNVDGPIFGGSSNVIQFGSSRTESVRLPPELALLHEKVIHHFNKDELKVLSFRLGIVDDDLRGETRSQLAQALIANCYRRDRLSDLLNQCKATRPHVDWLQSP